MKAKNTRWLIVSLSAATLFSIGAVRFFLRGDTVGALVYCAAAVLFLLVAFAYYKGFLK